MAEQVQIPGTQAVGKVRNPLAVVALAFITLGIYFFFWYFYVNRELKEVGQAAGTEECGTSPGTSLVAVTLGAFLIIPPFISLYNAFKRLNAAHKLTVGPGEAFDAGLGLATFEVLIVTRKALPALTFSGALTESFSFGLSAVKVAV
ncbi:MAG: DUF4234 domain-containing protein, partial [Solirubrobacterales bacterium]